MTRSHFPVLDGLRGFAAMIVVLFHSYKGGGLVPNGPLAVDLFFIMSGFVISNSYGSRLAVRMTKMDFIARRFARLYPMLFAGALGGGLLAIVHNLHSPDGAYPLAELIYSTGLALVALPYLNPSFAEEAFKFNPPIWSLFFEIIANILYVLIFGRINQRVLLLLVVGGLVGIVWFGQLGGGGASDIMAGVPRISFGFFGGVLLHQIWQRYPSLHIKLGFGPLVVVLLALFCVPQVIEGWLLAPSLLLLMLVVWCSVGNGAVDRRPMLEFMGEVSYPIYLMHWLTLYVFAYIGAKLGMTGDTYAVVVAVHLALTPLLGYLVLRFYETPMRALLERAVGIKRRRSVAVGV